EPAGAAAAQLTGEFELGPLDVTSDKLPKTGATSEAATSAALAQVEMTFTAANSRIDVPAAALASSLPTNKPVEIDKHLATTITSPEAMRGERTVEAMPQSPDPASIIDPPDARLTEVLKEIMHVDAARLEGFLADAREKAGQLRAIIKLPAREP